MEQVGFVRKIIKNKAEIEVKKISGCGGSCESCSGSCETDGQVVVIPNELNAKVGDFVEIVGESRGILVYALIVYMVPFSFLIAGILLGIHILKGQGIANYEPLGFLVGVVFMAIGFLLVKIIDKQVEKNDKNLIRMTKIL
ncbi:MAG: SoxR reducing system RseC family protein [Tissierellaceae bacterium]|nr:SoxR reducing system RseC family protein [Tissierellaceae bacterium]